MSRYVVARPELRAESDGTLSGVVMPYGEETDGPGFLEVFEPGSLDISGDIALNVMHVRERVFDRTGSGLRLTDDGKAVRMVSRPPDTRESRDAITNVKAGVYRGLSAEFKAIKDRYVGGVRRIQRAKLLDIGLVDRPAYRGASVESRAEIRQEGDGFAGFIPYEVPILVSMSRNVWVQLERRSLSESLRGSPEVYLLAGLNYDNALAGTTQGSLELRETDEGISFTATRVAATTAARDFRARLEAGMVRAVVPGLAAAQTDSVFRVIEDNPVEVVRRGVLCELRALTRSDHSGSNISGRGRRYAWPLL